MGTGWLVRLTAVPYHFAMSIRQCYIFHIILLVHAPVHDLDFCDLRLHPVILMQFLLKGQFSPTHDIVDPP